MGYLTLYSTENTGGAKSYFRHVCFAMLTHNISNVSKIGIYTLLNETLNKVNFDHKISKNYDKFIDLLIKMGVPLEKGENIIFPKNNFSENNIDNDCRSVYLLIKGIENRNQVLFYLTLVRYVYETYQKNDHNHKVIDKFLELAELFPKVDLYKLFIIAEWYGLHNSIFNSGHSNCTMEIKGCVVIPTDYTIKDRLKLIKSTGIDAIHTSYTSSVDLKRVDKTPYKVALEKLDKKQIKTLFKL